jgi:hypothetical protein
MTDLVEWNKQNDAFLIRIGQKPSVETPAPKPTKKDEE